MHYLHKANNILLKGEIHRKIAKLAKLGLHYIILNNYQMCIQKKNLYEPLKSFKMEQQHFQINKITESLELRYNDSTRGELSYSQDSFGFQEDLEG